MFFSKAKIFLTALLFFLFGVLLAILIIQNKEKPTPTPTLVPTPTAEGKLLANCQTYTNTRAGIELCLPEDWVIKTEEGPKGVFLAKILFQNPQVQLSVNVSRITASSNLSSFEALKEFWHLGRGGHAIEREEEILIADKQALYHVLSDAKPATMIDAHFINDGLLYDLIYNASPDFEKPEQLFQEILAILKLTPTDAMMSLTSGLEIVNPRAGEEISLPYLVIILDSAGIVSSSRERPTLVIKNQATQEITTLSTQPSVGSGEYEVSWQKGTPGEYQLTAQVIKEDGQIFESSPILVTVH